MPPDPLSRIPDEFVKGDTVTWTETIDDFSSDSWEMEVTFVPADATAGAAIQIDSDLGQQITKNSDGSYTGEISGSDSSSFTADTVYHWHMVMRDGTDRYTVQQGRVYIVTSYDVLSDAGGTHDVRSDTKKRLDQIRARLAGRTLLDQDSMTIGNRAISRMNIKELMYWEGVEAAKYQSEVRKERIARGLKTSRSVKVRFTE